MPMRDINKFFKRRSRGWAVYIKNTRGIRSKGSFILPRFRASHACIGDDFVEADLNKACASSSYGVIVAAPLFTGDNKLAGKSVAVG